MTSPSTRLAMLQDLARIEAEIHRLLETCLLTEVKRCALVADLERAAELRAELERERT